MLTLIVSPRAEEDLEEIWKFIAVESIQAADELIDHLVHQFEWLVTVPEAGRVRHELLVDLRSFPFKKYVIFYQIITDGIEIFRVLHGSRDIPRVFDELIG